MMEERAKSKWRMVAWPPEETGAQSVAGFRYFLATLSLLSTVHVEKTAKIYLLH
jgi:hypothetical protein